MANINTENPTAKDIEVMIGTLSKVGVKVNTDAAKRIKPIKLKKLKRAEVSRIDAVLNFESTRAVVIRGPKTVQVMSIESWEKRRAGARKGANKRWSARKK